jgi:hypothetical protein
MSATYQLETRLSGPPAEIKTTNEFVANAELARIDESIPNNSTDMLIVWTCDVSQVKCIVIVCDQDVLLETNSGSTPGNSISLKADKPYIWDPDSYNAFLLTVDVTGLYLTNASGAAAALKIAGLYDPTP